VCKPSAEYNLVLLRNFKADKPYIIKSRIIREFGKSFRKRIIPGLRFFLSILFLIICAHKHLKRKLLGDAFSFSQDFLLMEQEISFYELDIGLRRNK
jgi:hypothetical protein